MANSEHVSTETLADYAEGLLRESDAASVGAHLSGCPQCQAERLLLASLSDILAADDPGPMPAAYAARIDDALAKVAAAEPVTPCTRGPEPDGSALDLTPAALASASAQPSAEVTDLAARRRAAAQGLSRVTTVAASIVLLIGGTVLGLQALNSEDSTLDSPNQMAGASAEPVTTVRPSPQRLIRNPAVELDPLGKPNRDNSWTNRSGTVIRPDGTAILPDATVIEPPKKQTRPKKDPAAVAGPEIPSRPVTKSDGRVTTAQKPRASAPVTDPAANPVSGFAATAEPEPEAEPEVAPEAASTSAPEMRSQTQSAEKSAAGPRASPPGTRPQTRPQTTTYVEESGSEYTEANFAEKVLALVEKAGYQAASTGTPQPDPAEEAPAERPKPAVARSASAAQFREATPFQDATQFQEASRFEEASVGTSGPGVADAPDAPGGPGRGDARGPASDRVKQRVERCARQFGGTAIAGDTGTWKGRPVTIVVLPDPDDERQVVGRAVSGPCTPERPASNNVEHTQYVYLKP